MTFSYCQTTTIYVKSIRADVSTKSANSSLISILLNSKKKTEITLSGCNNCSATAAKLNVQLSMPTI